MRVHSIQTTVDHTTKIHNRVSAFYYSHRQALHAWRPITPATQAKLVTNPIFIILL